MKPSLSRHVLSSLLPFSLVGCAVEQFEPGPGVAPIIDIDFVEEPAQNGQDLEVIGDAPADPDEDTASVPVAAHLPVMLVTTEGPLQAEQKVGGSLVIVEEHDGSLTDLDEAPRAFAGAIGIEIHGTSSSLQPKPSLRFECRDEVGANTNCSPVGLPEGTEWVLHAPLADKTYMRNALAYELGRAAAVGPGRWEPRTAFVELLVDGEYRGVYVLVERISPETERLDLPDTTNPTSGLADGGFIVKVDQGRGLGFDTLSGTPIDYVWPKATELTPPEAGHLSGWFNGFETTLLGERFTDPDRGYATWIDVDAWVDHWLISELTNNIDSYRLSGYLWSDGPPGVGKLRAGPLWDYDRGFGNASYCGGERTEGWIAENLETCSFAGEIPFWWARLREDPAFELRLRARWQLLRDGTLTDEFLSARIEAMRVQTAEAEVRDHALWPVIGVEVFPNAYVGETWDDEVDFLETWLLDRAAWMDAALAE